MIIKRFNVTNIKSYKLSPYQSTPTAIAIGSRIVPEDLSSVAWPWLPTSINLDRQTTPITNRLPPSETGIGEVCYLHSDFKHFKSVLFLFHFHLVMHEALNPHLLASLLLDFKYYLFSLLLNRSDLLFSFGIYHRHLLIGFGIKLSNFQIYLCAYTNFSLLSLTV